MPAPHQLGKQRINTLYHGHRGHAGRAQLTLLGWGVSCVSFWTCLCLPPLIWDSGVFPAAVLPLVTDTAASQTGLKSIPKGGVFHLKDLQPKTSSFPIPTCLCCLRFYSSVVVLVAKLCLTLLQPRGL